MLDEPSSIETFDWTPIDSAFLEQKPVDKVLGCTSFPGIGNMRLCVGLTI